MRLGTPLETHLSACMYLICHVSLVESPSKQEINEFMQEIEFMKAIGYHENVLAILGCCTQQMPLCLIVEYVPNGDLQSYLRKLRKEVSNIPVY